MKDIFEGEVQGSVTMDMWGQIVIPAKAREALRIKPEDKLIVIVSDERKIIGLMPAVDLDCLLGKTAKTISRLEKRISPRRR